MDDLLDVLLQNLETMSYLVCCACEARMFDFNDPEQRCSFCLSDDLTYEN